MNMDTLDMSVLAKGWEVGNEATMLRLGADGRRPITLEFKATHVTPPAAGRILIMQARRNSEELWAIRMLPSGRLLLQPGTAPSRECLYGYPGELSLGVSFNPATHALSVVVRDGGLLERGPIESFNLFARAPWASPEEDYEILLGAPATYVDQSPLGWRIDCSFRYGEPVAQEDPVLGAEEPWNGSPEERAKFLQDWVRKDLGHGMLDALRTASPAAQHQRAFVPPTGRGLDELRDLARTVVGIDGAERHWQAMLALASGRYGAVAINPTELAAEAAQLVAAHEVWRKEQS